MNSQTTDLSYLDHRIEKVRKIIEAYNFEPLEIFS